eukprot:COSAG05_NODE_519_length_9047_cov_25.276263_10_plen_73_part_00
MPTDNAKPAIFRDGEAHIYSREDLFGGSECTVAEVPGGAHTYICAHAACDCTMMARWLMQAVRTMRLKIIRN